MASSFKQLRFYNYEEDTPNNEPQLSGSSINSPSQIWTDGTVFKDYLPASQLGIIAPPGTRFYINGSASYATVGYTGLFELDLRDSGVISSLSFNQKSLDYIASNPAAYLIVDLVYEPEEE